MLIPYLYSWVFIRLNCDLAEDQIREASRILTRQGNVCSMYCSGVAPSHHINRPITDSICTSHLPLPNLAIRYQYILTDSRHSNCVH